MSAAAIAPPFAPPKARDAVRAPVRGRRIEPLSVQTAPALYAACCFASGVLLSHTLYEPPALALAVIVLAAIAAWTAAGHVLRTVLAPLSLAWIAAGLFCTGIQPAPNPQAALLASTASGAHTLVGYVVRAGPIRTVETTAPFASHAVREKSQSLDLQVAGVADGAATLPISGGARLTVYATAEEPFSGFHCGQELRVLAAAHPPERYNDPGVWNSTAYLLEQGISVIASAKAPAVAVLRGPEHTSLPCRLKALQQAASERVMALADTDSSAPPGSGLPAFFRLSSEDASMLAAMITGDRSWLERRTRIGFERTGSFHLLVVSGLHLAIFAGLIFWIAQRLRLPRLWASLLTITAALAYAVFTGFGQPVQRSFWMITLYLLGRLLWRERSALNAIGFAALCLLAANPAGLFDAGFQMTLLSVVAIAGIATPLAERSFAPYLRATRNLPLLAIDPSLPPKAAQFRVSLRLLAIHLAPLTGKRFAYGAPATMLGLGLRILELLLVSVIVEIAMSLPMALYFHRVTVLALPVNFLIVPFLGLLLPCALLTFATLLISAKLATVPAAVTAALLHSVTALIHAFAGIRAADLRLPGPSPAAIAIFVVLLGFSVYAARLPRLAIPLCTMALALMATAVLIPQAIRHRAGVLEVTAIDVGQGDSLLVVTPEGKTLLIDAGGSPFGPPPGVAHFDVGEEVVSAYLWSRGIRRLDAVALTHAHADHMGGMPAVLANFRPHEIWVGNNPHSAAYDAFLAEARSFGATISSLSGGEQMPFGSSTRVEVLAPAAGYHPGPTAANNDSLVLKIRYGQTSALLEGDAEAPSEERMIAEGNLHADLLKIGHHGSRSSTTPAFLAAVRPAWSVISVGRRNFYGHPRIEILEELQAKQVRTYRTDTLGLSSFYLDGQRVTAAVFSDQAR